jgi:AcrR family transcriptional regulator
MNAARTQPPPKKPPSKPSSKTAPAATAPGGRDRLMGAALALASTTRNLASLGLREVSRHAGLNPNTFYRHFRNFDELGLAVIDKLGGQLRQGLRERRTRPAASGVNFSDVTQSAESLQRAQDIVAESVALVLDFVTHHQEAYVVGIRELHGSSPLLRKALRQLLDDIAADMAEDVLGLLHLPVLDHDTVLEISSLAIRQMTFFSLDYLEQPDQRDDIRRQAERFILLLFWGALAAKAPELLAAAKLKFPER